MPLSINIIEIIKKLGDTLEQIRSITGARKIIVAPGEGFEPSRPYGHQLSRPEPRTSGMAPYQAGRPRLIIHPPKPRFKDSTQTFKRHHIQVEAVNPMHQNWLQRSENTIKTLRQLMDNPDQDRLELVRVMRFAFGALGTSLAGWMQWVNSPEIMSSFTKEELQEMAKTITGMAEKFVAYDIEITDKGTRKGLAKQREEEQRDIRFVI